MPKNRLPLDGYDGLIISYCRKEIPKNLEDMIGMILLSGIGGTALMTAMTNLIAYITRQRFQVVYILGTMLTNQTTLAKGLSTTKTAYFTGLFVHYLVGVGWAALYLLYWILWFPSANSVSVLLFGLLIAVLAMAGWRLFITLHPNPPRLLVKSYLAVIGLGHFIFTFGMIGTLYVLA